MYVCICNRYREAEIRAAATSGVTCASEVYASLGNGPRCGRCLSFAQEVVDQVHAGAGAPRVRDAA